MAAELLPLRALDLKDAKKFGIFCKNQKIPNVLVDLKRLELSTSRMRTERSPEWFRYMHPKFLENSRKYKNIEKI